MSMFLFVEFGSFVTGLIRGMQGTGYSQLPKMESGYDISGISICIFNCEVVKTQGIDMVLSIYVTACPDIVRRAPLMSKKSSPPRCEA